MNLKSYLYNIIPRLLKHYLPSQISVCIYGIIKYKHWKWRKTTGCAILCKDSQIQRSVGGRETQNLIKHFGTLIRLIFYSFAETCSLI